MDFESIKQLVITSVFSNDDLMELLVLKGGNALDLLCKTNLRSSIDVDFSLGQDFPTAHRDEILNRLQKEIESTFFENGYIVFDYQIERRPKGTDSEMDFWGGYRIEFKIIEKEAYAQFRENIVSLRNKAIQIGSGKRFSIDISKYEYTEPKIMQYLNGFHIYVYSPEMMICEKLRAICQQMREYGPIIKRTRQSTQRARDFLDIYTLCTEYEVDLASEKNQLLLKNIFDVKKVPLSLLGLIPKYRDFHKLDFPSVVDTIKVGTRVEDFDFYFDYTLRLIDRLKSPWDI